MKKVLIISMALNLCLFGKYKKLKRKNELLKVDVEDIKDTKYID